MGDTKRLRGGRRTNWRDRAADTSSFGKPQPQLVSAHRRPIGSPPFASRIKTVGSSLRLTRRWSELALNPQSPQQTTLSRSSFSPTRRSWSGRKNSNLFTGGTTGSNPICSANRWLLVMRSGWDLRLPAVVPELLKAADPQTRRVPSCHSRPPGRAGRRCRRNCAGRA